MGCCSSWVVARLGRCWYCRRQGYCSAERVENSIRTPGHTLEVAFNDKCRDYSEACEREGITFIPLPVETLGGWHKKAVDQFRKLARSTGKEEDDAIRHLFQWLGVLLVKGNAALLLNRIPSFRLPSD